MYVTEDEQFFIMNLLDGYQYQQAEPNLGDTEHPFIRTRFEEWTKVFDLGEFDLNRTDEDLFKGFHAMLSSRQLNANHDTLKSKIAKINDDMKNNLEDQMTYLGYELILHDKVVREPGPEPVRKKPSRRANHFTHQPYLDSLHPGESILYSFAEGKRKRFVDDALSRCKTVFNIHNDYIQQRSDEALSKAKNRYEYHSRFGLALSCLLFLFIGAPMGAIVRKGGFGYPLLVAIVFFMIFMILTITFKKLARTMAIDPIIAGWFPTAVLFPVGIWLTYKAMNDSKLFSANWVTNLRIWFQNRFKQVNSHSTSH